MMWANAVSVFNPQGLQCGFINQYKIKVYCYQPYALRPLFRHLEQCQLLDFLGLSCVCPDSVLCLSCVCSRSVLFLFLFCRGFVLGLLSTCPLLVLSVFYPASVLVPLLCLLRVCCSSSLVLTYFFNKPGLALPWLFPGFTWVCPGLLLSQFWFLPESILVHFIIGSSQILPWVCPGSTPVLSCFFPWVCSNSLLGLSCFFFWFCPGSTLVLPLVCPGYFLGFSQGLSWLFSESLLSLFRSFVGSSQALPQLCPGSVPVLIA